ncbi:MAG: oxygen-independent coproporphyrinogen III oxidase [Gammaproteobacteria bacterium]
MDTTIFFDSKLIGKYNTAGPRYTSYPTAVQFHEGFSEAEYGIHARASNVAGRPLSLYFHLPFCDTVCYYCACNKIVTKNRSHVEPYLAALKKEMALQAELFDRDRPVTQLHWGGGTPTFSNGAQMRALACATAECFHVLADDSGEYSIEIDPREVEADTIALLREIGFNRLSMGVQDFDPVVQNAVNRIQSIEQTAAVIGAARREGFKSVSVDLIYGLPHQSVASFDRTLDVIIDLEPDRLSVFNYAHLPALFKVQRQIDAATLPAPAVKLEILSRVIERLSAVGYVYIGMDHFAKPDDELAQAQHHRSLYRNFQGYSTHADCDLVAFGITAIGKVGDCYSQNVKTLNAYYDALANDRLPVYRGITLSADDRLRRAVITELICHFALDFAAIEARHGIVFAEYFRSELERLDALAADGLLRLSPSAIDVSAAGRLLIRNICMVFDRYLQAQPPTRFSKAI